MKNLPTISDRDLDRMYEAVGRSCGPCTACCEVIGVRELSKSYQTRCAHQSDPGAKYAGCVIYGGRPLSCKEYFCSWLSGHVRPEYRPDLCGVIVDLAEESSNGKLYADAYVFDPNLDPEKAFTIIGEHVDALRTVTDRLGSLGSLPTLAGTRIHPPGRRVVAAWDTTATVGGGRLYEMVSGKVLAGLPVYFYLGASDSSGKLMEGEGGTG